MSKRLLVGRSAFLLILLMLSGYAWTQDRVITGSVTDSKDATPLIGVSVLVKGTKIGTKTDADGSFRLTVPANAQTLVFSSVGYGQQEVAITGSAVQINLVSRQFFTQ